MATLSAFHDTRNLYRDFTDYKKPLSFEEWNTLDPEKKAAVLFVQFYNEITLAWNKANAFDFIDGEDGVSTMCQYLQKNVPVIEKDPKRFTPNYIYKVACICHDRKCDKDRWENETSSIVMLDGKEFNILETVVNMKGSAEAVSEKRQFEGEFWSVVKELGEAAEKVMRYLISQDEADLKKLSPKSRRYAEDPLRDVEVSLEEAQRIILILRQRFLSMPKNSCCGEYICNFVLA